MRGRNRPKGPNPLTRSYESNGPDIKLRGTAQHIADKYAQLARDALASGDPIAAENYFQHGEHYFRIITSAQEPNRPQAAQGYARHAFEDEDEGDEDVVPGRNGAPYGDQGRDHGRREYGQGSGDSDYGDPGQQPQPFERHDYEGRQQNRNDRNERPDHRRDRFQNRNDRQRFDGNRQDHGRGDGRQDYGRQDYRQDYGRQDRHDFQANQNNRQDARHDQGRDQNRQDFNRDDQPRERDGGRFENGRGDHPRQGAGWQDAESRNAPRGGESRADRGSHRERRRDEQVRGPAEETGGLPAFLMTATRNPSPSPAEDASEPAPSQSKQETSRLEEATPDGVGEETAVAPKPRRRRARYKAGEGQDGGQEAAGQSTDAPSTVE